MGFTWAVSWFTCSRCAGKAVELYSCRRYDWGELRLAGVDSQGTQYTFSRRYNVLRQRCGCTLQSESRRDQIPAMRLECERRGRLFSVAGSKMSEQFPAVALDTTEWGAVPSLTSPAWDLVAAVSKRFRTVSNGRGAHSLCYSLWRVKTWPHDWTWMFAEW